jgi:hypothetical protein
MPFFHTKSLKDITKPIIDAIPGARAIVQRVRHGKKPPPEFSGWGMSTNRVPPWKNETALSRAFLKTNEELVRLVREGKFQMTQYAEVIDKEEVLRSLMWRHYAIFWSAQFSSSKSGALVECGVSDGLTAYFAIKAHNNSRKAYLYDAWTAMAQEDLLESESRHSGDYGYLTLERTKNNLRGLNAAYVKGHIPEVFSSHSTPQEIIWLHIDLNASKPTLESLQEMYDHVISGGIIIFDDYAGRAFYDTRHVVDTFFANKNGMLLPIPTGQALFFKH